jgi:hypothetical protein
MEVLKSSRENIRVNDELKTNVSEIFSVSIIRVNSDDGDISRSMKRWFLTLTQLIAREDFSTFILRESFKSYMLE